ncbi:MAG: hypothetical protein IKY83_06095 [Proteobacteria bacterium]|nr:hypothetical protein [Pseudomonadota bacterium]
MLIFAMHVMTVIAALQGVSALIALPLPIGQKTCFSPTEESEELARDQVIRCFWAHPGTYPPQEARFYWLTRRCCFSEPPSPGVFWAIGESVTSRLTAFAPDDTQATRASFAFELDQALLFDLLVLDAVSDAPVPGARVTLSNDAVHLVSAVYYTDADGYAVLPVLPDIQYIASIRADAYLTPAPVQIFWPSEDRDMPEKAVELDPGISVSGLVTDPDGQPVADAKIQAEIELAGGGSWRSDIDQPLPIAAFSSPNTPWIPYRGSFSSSENGRFRLETLPRGKMRLFATHARYAPGPVVTVDTSDDADPGQIRLLLMKPRRAWVRVENEAQSAVAASLTAIDTRTGFEQISTRTKPSGALELQNLPEDVRFRVSADGYVFHQENRHISDGDEIVITLEARTDTTLSFKLMDENGAPLPHVTLSLADREQQKAHPICLAKTDSQGKAQLTECPQNFWLDIYHPDIVHELRHVASGGPERELYLAAGSDVTIEMRDTKTGMPVLEVSCTLETAFSSDGKVHKLTEKHAVRDGRLTLEHRGAQACTLACATEDGNQSQASFTCARPPKALDFKHYEQRQAAVLDAFGAPVPYARIQIGPRTLETDETGHIQLSAEPGTRLDIRHYQHGHATLAFEAGTGTFEMRLPDRPDEAVTKCLEARNLKYVVDSAEIRLDIMPNERNMMRGDSVEQCDTDSLVVVRDGRRIHLR